jgi:catalase (peroxidase I)
MGMENIFNDGNKVVEMSEDEFNNLLIDIHVAMKEAKNKKPQFPYYDSATGEVKFSDTPVTATFTLSMNKE